MRRRPPIASATASSVENNHFVPGSGCSGAAIDVTAGSLRIVNGPALQFAEGWTVRDVRLFEL